MNVKFETKQTYFERINPIVNYINNHLDEPLDLKKLAALGNYSPFHFHRIMRAYLGESLVSYVIRIRLETAANLLRYTELPVNDIAFKTGYENLSSFSKAFKKRFGISAIEFRQNNDAQILLNKTILKSKGMENLKNTEPKIKEVKSRRVIYAQARGPYDKSAGEAWETVCAFAKKKHLFGFSTEMIGISYDDPKITDAEKLRYDACIVISKEIEAEGEIGTKEIAGGKYAVFTHRGPYEQFINSYDFIFGEWIKETKFELRDVPCLEKYLNSPDKTKPEKLLTEIWVPVK